MNIPWLENVVTLLLCCCQDKLRVLGPSRVFSYANHQKVVQSRCHYYSRWLRLFSWNNLAIIRFSTLLYPRLWPSPVPSTEKSLRRTRICPFWRCKWVLWAIAHYSGRTAYKWFLLRSFPALQPSCWLFLCFFHTPAPMIQCNLWAKWPPSAIPLTKHRSFCETTWSIWAALSHPVLLR